VCTSFNQIWVVYGFYRLTKKVVSVFVRFFAAFNVDTYKYFGEPVYIYSLKEGINDG
jgi:hypothetical protein